MNRNIARHEGCTIFTGILLTTKVSWFLQSSVSLNPTSKSVVKNSIATEYQRYHLSRKELNPQQKANLLMTIQRLKIRSLSARGEPEQSTALS